MVSPNEEIVRTLIIGSPFGTLMGLRAEAIEREGVRLRMPFRPELVTVADVVHGGAIASLVDVAATAAAWAGADAGQGARGTTIGVSLSFLAAGRGQDLLANARAIQRGRTICVLDVDVADDDGTAVARALVTYKLG